MSREYADLSFEIESAEFINEGTVVVEPELGEEEEIQSAQQVVPEAKKRNKFKWNIESTWNTLEDVLMFLEEAGFVNYDCSELKCGQKFYFRCKHIPKKREEWCAKRYTIYLPSQNLDVLLLSNGCGHDHDDLLKGKKRQPSEEMNDFITDLFECDTFKTDDVIKHIELARRKYGLFATEDNPDSRQIEYALRKFRNAKVPKMLKVGDLMDWCHKNSETPSDPNDAFVIGSQSSSHDENLYFGFAFSTILLLQILKNVKTICIDATYKLNWQGFPLMVLGTVDRTKRFYPLVYACCSHERATDYTFIFECVKKAIRTHFNEDFSPEVLIADGADAIRNAYYESFISAKLDVMCFAHVIRNCYKRPFASKNNKPLVIDDIRKMQLAPNRSTFKMMCDLFVDKWKLLEPNFVEYFQKEWLGVHCNWFEGAADYIPSTNNSQESHNAVIKRKITLRRRLPMNQFMACMKEMTADISKQFSKGERALKFEPNIKKTTFEKAAEMIKRTFQSFKAKQAPNSNKAIFSVPSSKCAIENATPSYFKTLQKKTWNSFDEFIVHSYQQFYVVEISFDNWNSESTCTCREFFKEHMCKHIIAIAVQQNIATIPESANPAPLVATRRKPGRPRRTAHALRLQQ